MVSVQQKNTRPELLVRSYLHRRGLRYRLHVTDLPGKPDMVFPKLKTTLFVNGCFWHGHQDSDCKLARIPKSNVGSTPLERTLQRRPILGQEECHGKAKEVQRGI